MGCGRRMWRIIRQVAVAAGRIRVSEPMAVQAAVVAAVVFTLAVQVPLGKVVVAVP